ncbi:MAG: gliding motility-associated C-terminal domain-containing protein [Saprospiraceae bacterium]|nr:gliding motility-associated C-terminal domain-containing protein [Saprospiraceae bacterium]
MASVVSDSYNICEGQSVTLGSSGGLFYEWSDPNGTLSGTDIPNPTATPVTTTNYSVTVSDNCPNNVEVFDIVVNVNDPPVADAGRDTCVLSGQIYELNASGGIAYSWDNQDLIVGSTFTANAQVQLIDSTTIFTVTVTDVNGCADTDQVEICVVDDPTELIEEVSVMTPNGDGKNDALIFRGLEAFPENKLTIFNRWGNIIYQTVGYQRDGLLWEGLRDGEELPPDTYYYVLEFAEFKIKSSLTILRD